MSNVAPLKIAVIGLGKIGLPLAVQYAHKGHDVVGVDVNPTTVATINAGVEPFPGEADLARLLGDVVGAGKLRATTQYGDAVPGSDAVVVVVPLFVDAAGRPDFDWMDSASRDIGRQLTAGTLVSYETTLPVGTTRNRWKPLLEAESGLVEGVDFHVAFSPERVLTGRIFTDLRRYPKIVGGLSADGTRRAVDLYERVLDFDPRPDLARGNGVWDVGSVEAAELTKLAETTYRDVNIGLANQFARYADSAGIDIYNVIAAANSQPYSHIHTPGIAVGGHCIPVYPQLYLWTDPDADVVRSARRANAAMPRYAVDQLVKAYGDVSGAKVAVLGAAYRGGVKETAFSGVFPVVEALRDAGAVALVHDPLYSDDELRDLGLNPYRLGSPVDAVVVQANHECYRTLTHGDLPGVRVILDGRQALDLSRWTDAVTIVLGHGVPLTRTHISG